MGEPERERKKRNIPKFKAGDGKRSKRKGGNDFDGTSKTKDGDSAFK